MTNEDLSQVNPNDLQERLRRSRANVETLRREIRQLEREISDKRRAIAGGRRLQRDLQAELTAVLALGEDELVALLKATAVGEVVTVTTDVASDRAVKRSTNQAAKLAGKRLEWRRIPWADSASTSPLSTRRAIGRNLARILSYFLGNLDVGRRFSLRTLTRAKEIRVVRQACASAAR